MPEDSGASQAQLAAYAETEGNFDRRPTPIFTVSRNGVVVSANEAALTAMDMKSGDVLDRTVESIAPELASADVFFALAEKAKSIHRHRKTEEFRTDITLTDEHNRKHRKHVALIPQFVHDPARRNKIIGWEVDVVDRTEEQAQKASAETAKLLIGANSLEDVLARVASVLHKAVPYTKANLMIFDGNRELIVSNTWDKDHDERQTPMKSRGLSSEERGTLNYMKETHKSLHIRDTDASDIWKKRDGDEIRSYIGTPLVIRGEVVGFLNVTHEDADFFAENDVTDLESIAAQISMAIDNAQLIEELQDQARFDTLTRLPRRKYFEELINETVETAVRKKHPYCFMMVDGDHFKNVNDTYGHAAGDDVLREIANRLDKGRRHTDTLGRYGGEEFVLMLPESLSANALGAAIRLKQAIRQSPIDTNKDAVVSLTASVGIVVMDNDELRTRVRPKDEEMKNLVDIALYAVKQNGRDGVGIYHVTGDGREEVVVYQDDADDPGAVLISLFSVVNEEGISKAVKMQASSVRVTDSTLSIRNASSKHAASPSHFDIGTPQKQNELLIELGNPFWLGTYLDYVKNPQQDTDTFRH